MAAACSFPDSFYHTINCRPAEISDFVLKAEDPDAKWAEVNVMKIGTFGTATTPVKRRVEVKDGVLDWKSADFPLQSFSSGTARMEIPDMVLWKER